MTREQTDDDIHETLAQEYFEQEALNDLPAPNKLEYVGYSNNTFYFRSCGGILTVNLTQLIGTMLESESVREWPIDFPNYVESNQYSLIDINKENRIITGIVIEFEDLPRPILFRVKDGTIGSFDLAAFTSKSETDSTDFEDPLDDMTDNFLDSISRTNIEFKECIDCARQVETVSGTTRIIITPSDNELTDKYVHYTARLVEAEVELEFEFIRPSVDNEFVAEPHVGNFEELVELCGGVPDDVVDTELELGFAIEDQGIATDSTFGLWSIRSNKTEKKGGLLSRFF